MRMRALRVLLQSLPMLLCAALTVLAQGRLVEPDIKIGRAHV